MRRLAGSAMGLDVYGWLAQRLHRIKPNAPAFITWAALKGQFGWHYKRMNQFKAEFRQTLRQVLTVYPAARVELDGPRHDPLGIARHPCGNLSVGRFQTQGIDKLSASTSRR